MTKAEWEKLYDDINTFTDEGGQTASGLYEQGLVTDEQKEKLDKLKEEIDELLKNLTCAVKEGEKQKGSDGIIENECEEKEKELKEKIAQYNNELKETTGNACIWNVGEREELKGKTFYFQQKVEDKALHKLKSGDFPLSFNRFGNVYTFSSNGQVYYPEAGTGKFTTKDVVKYYQFENASEPISISVNENADDQITIGGQKEIAMKDCSSGNKDKGKGLGKGTLYTKNVEGRYKVTVTENNGKISSKFELTGQGDSKTASQKQKIEQQVQTLIDEKLKELGGLNNKTSPSVNTSTEDGGEFYVKQMNGKEWLGTLENLGVSVWENATMPEDYWNKDKNYSASNIHIPPTFAGVGDGVIGEISDYPQLIKLGYDVSTKQEVREGLWKAVKNINLGSIKTAATGVLKNKWNAYTNSPGHITYHEMGKDGVTVVSLAMGAGFFKKGTDGLKDGIEDTGEKFVKKEVDEISEVLGKIVKNGNKIEYTNPAGKILKWSEQGVKDIDNAIMASRNLDPLNSNNIGRITEGKVGEFVKNKKQIVGFGQKIDPNITDLDVSTIDEIIEVKASFSSVKEGQFAKLLDENLDNFCNPHQKKVILYIDKPVNEATQSQINMINRIKQQGVIVVNSLDELGQILK